MASLQDTSITAGLAIAAEFTGRAVVYHRLTASLSFSAIAGKYSSQAVDGVTVIGEVQLDDWLFPVAAIASLTPAEPGRKDWIEVGGLRYDLIEVPGLGSWGWMDPQRTWVRVHTKLTGPV